MALIYAAIFACHFGARLLVPVTNLRQKTPPRSWNVICTGLDAKKDAAIAPAVERTLGKGEVACSNHAGSTIPYFIFDVTN